MVRTMSTALVVAAGVAVPAIRDAARTGTFTTNLTSGRYGIVCCIPDVKDGKPHKMHGMVQEFTVAAK
jgi:hypothetical protein